MELLDKTVLVKTMMPTSDDLPICLAVETESEAWKASEASQLIWLPEALTDSPHRSDCTTDWTVTSVSDNVFAGPFPASTPTRVLLDVAFAPFVH